MSAADKLTALLVEEEAALRRGDAEAVLLFAKRKRAVRSLSEDPPAEAVLALLENNRLCWRRLGALNQVLGNPSTYGADPTDRSGRFLSESA